MQSGVRWRVSDKNGNSIYLAQERWEHIIEPINHPVRFREQAGEVVPNNYIVTAYQKEIG